MLKVRNKEGGEIRFGEIPTLETKQGRDGKGVGMNMRSSARLRLILIARCGRASSSPCPRCGFKHFEYCPLISRHF